MPLWQQVLIGAVGITILEFLTGCIVNLWLGWGVWDYSNLPGKYLRPGVPAVRTAMATGISSRDCVG